jgi:hypothetical protein
MFDLKVRGRGVAVAVTGCLIALAGTAGAAVRAGAMAGPGESTGAGTGQLAIRTLSNRADLISGDDALVGISLPTGTARSRVRIRVNGRDVTTSFGLGAYGSFRGLLGLVTGLKPGRSAVTAQLEDGRGAQLVLTAHPRGGPVFAGPQVQPWICSTHDSGLGPARDAQCDAPTQLTYFYVSTDPSKTSFQPYVPSNPAHDVATTTTDQGVTVPYIVRLETGVEDRGIYRIAVLDDPARPWSALAPQRAWNHKVAYWFGGGTAPHHTQDSPQAVLDDSHLRRGFLIAASSLNVHGSDANDTVSAEALMMLKEHIAESYGYIRYVIGEGCSGGGLQQYIIADTYPGLLDGILPSCSFPDIWSTAPSVFDCILFNRYFNQSPPAPGASGQQRAAVTGYQDPAGCVAIDAEFGGLISAASAANCNLPVTSVYDPVTRPGGTRCTMNDYQIAIWGQRARSSWGAQEKKLSRGFANRPYDNVGLQYGLAALQAGEITPAQFADLNANIGGHTLDGLWQPQRSAAEPATIATAYRAGQVMNGRYLSQAAVLDLRGPDNEEIHQALESHIIQARLQAANGSSANQAIWTGAVPLLGDASWALCGFGNQLGGGGQPGGKVPLGDFCLPNSPLLVMDRWLTAIEADRSPTPRAQKVINDKPKAAVDSCWLSPQAQITDPAACAALFPYFGNPRISAGAPKTDDVLKCQLQPLDRKLYTVTFSDADWAKLQHAFPTGVCNWRKPGVGQQAPLAAWLTFAGGPGGRPLGPAPQSVTFQQATPAKSAGGARPGRSLAATGLTLRMPVGASLLLFTALAAWRRRIDIPPNTYVRTRRGQSEG